MRSLPASRIAPRHAAIGALALGILLPVTAPTLAPAQLAPALARVSSTVPRAPALRDATLRLGQRADVRGRLAASDVGRSVALQFAPRGERWRTIATTSVAAGGRYRFRVRLERSGKLRVAPLAGAAAPLGGERPAAGVEGGTTGVVAVEAAPASRARHVAVAGRLVVRRRGRDVHAGATVRVRGTLLPRARGRRIVVEAGADGHWHAVARSRTRADGHFDARLVAESAGTQRLRVRFAGDRRNAGTRAGAGTLQAYRPTLASWYALYGGALACGGTLGYETLGVANKTLPCGTKVTLRYHGREVTVRVIDRGPYVGGREWDLTGATARALGFDGVGVVWSTR